MGQGRAHLGDAEAKASVHDGHDQESNQHSAETSGGETEIPAKEIPGDDRSYSERPQRPHARVTLETSFLEVLWGRLLVLDALFHRSIVGCGVFFCKQKLKELKMRGCAQGEFSPDRLRHEGRNDALTDQYREGLSLEVEPRTSSQGQLQALTQPYCSQHGGMGAP